MLRLSYYFLIFVLVALGSYGAWYIWQGSSFSSIALPVNTKILDELSRVSAPIQLDDSQAENKSVATIELGPELQQAPMLSEQEIADVVSQMEVFSYDHVVSNVISEQKKQLSQFIDPMPAYVVEAMQRPNGPEITQEQLDKAIEATMQFYE